MGQCHPIQRSLASIRSVAGRTCSNSSTSSGIQLLECRYSLALNEEDTKVINESWQSIKAGKKNVGIPIFKRIFSIQPALKKSFGLQDVPLNKLETNAKFISHAQNFTDFVKIIIENIDVDSHAIALKTASKIGKLHAAIALNDDSVFDADYWMLFVDCCVVELMLQNNSSHSKSKVRAAWQHLLMRLVLEMKVAFYKEILSALQPASADPSEPSEHDSESPTSGKDSADVEVDNEPENTMEDEPLTNGVTEHHALLDN